MIIAYLCTLEAHCHNTCNDSQKLTLFLLDVTDSPLTDVVTGLIITVIGEMIKFITPLVDVLVVFIKETCAVV